MLTSDVMDEAVIDAPPAVVCRAVLDEYAGATSWWRPRVEAKLKEGTPGGKEGMVSDMAVHGPGTARFTCKVTKIVEGRSIDIEYGGDFLGDAYWTFEPAEGKTRIRFRWKVRSNRLLFVLVSPFINMGKFHSETMQEGFKSLNSHLNRM